MADARKDTSSWAEEQLVEALPLEFPEGAEAAGQPAAEAPVADGGETEAAAVPAVDAEPACGDAPAEQSAASEETKPAKAKRATRSKRAGGKAASAKKATGTPAADDAAAEDAEAAAAAKRAAAEAAAAAEALLAQKDAVRREALSRRQELRPATRSARSREICNQLLSELQASGIKGRNGRPATISVYAALRFEVDLDRFIRGAYALGYRIAFPCMTPKDRAGDRTAGMMCMRSVSCLNYVGGSVPFIVDPRKPWGPAVAEEHQQFTNTPTGSRRRFIPSRVKGSIPPKDDTRFPVVPPSEIDMAIIPAVAFDADGRRLGYGTGIYDRYLPQLREDCHVLGVAFAEQEVTEVPCDEHDRSLPRYITA